MHGCGKYTVSEIVSKYVNENARRKQSQDAYTKKI